MAQTIASLLIKIGVQVSEVNKGFKQVESKMKGLQKGFSKTAKSLGLAFGGTAVIGGIKNMVKAAGDFQLDLAKLNQTAGLSADELSKVGNQAQSLAGKFGVSSNEIVQGLTELNRLGFSTADALGQLPQILKFNIATGSDFHTTVGLMETALKDFNLGINQTGKITDIFTAAIAHGRISTNDLADAFKKAGASGKNAGASVADVSAAASILATKGFSGAEAGTSLNAIFGNLTKTGSGAQKAIQGLGISLTDSSGKLRPFGEVITDIQKKTQGMTDAQKNNIAQQIAGKEHMAKFLAIVGGAPGTFENYSASLDKSSGKTNEFFQKIDETSAQSMAKLSETFTVFQQKLGEALGPAIKVVVDAIQGLLEWFNNLSPAVQTTIAVIGAVVAGFIALGAIIAAISLAFSALAPVISIIAGVFTFLLSPIGAVIAIVAALVTGITILWKKNEAFRNAIIAIWNGIKAFFAGIPGFFTGIWNAVTSATTNAWNKIKSSVSNAWSFIKSIFSQMISGAARWGLDMFRNFANGIARGFQYVKDKVMSAVNWIKSKIGFSKPDSGPLKDADTWMPDFMKLLATGIETSLPQLQMAVGDVAMTLAGAGSDAAMGSVVNNNVNVYPRQANLDARGLNRELERMRFLNGGMF